MSPQPAKRSSYEESCRILQQLKYLGEGIIPPIPEHPGYDPENDDEDHRGITFFRAWVGVGRPFGLQPFDPAGWEDVPEHALDNLTLPRTFFGKSEIGPISFKNTDLSESTLCWNDFIKVDFTDADLSGADLRAAIFRQVAFVRTNLRNADLRRSNFEVCDFTDADMRGAKLTREQTEQIALSHQQQNVIDWQESEGDEPPGG